MRTIWKFPLKLQDEPQVIVMPKDAKLLFFGSKGQATIDLWAEVETLNKSELRTFIIYGTGHEINRKDVYYVGSTIDPPFVWHLYEGMKGKKIW